MFDVSFSQLLVVSVVTLTVIGRKDMPSAARMLGTGVGNSVSFLRFVRQSADKFTASIEASEGSAALDIKSLRDEVNLGLREMEEVRQELVSGVDNARMGVIMKGGVMGGGSRGSDRSGRVIPPMFNDATSKQTNQVGRASAPQLTTTQPAAPTKAVPLASSSLTAAAVAESTWSGEVSQIPKASFTQAVGERGYGAGGAGDDGASALAELYKETLIMDHYERVKDK